MAGYIGKSQGVTQVDGYNRTEADGRYVNASGDTMTGGLTVTGSNFANTTYTGTSVNPTGVYTGLTSDGGFTINVRDSGYLQLSTNNTERVRVDSAGYVTTPYNPAFVAFMSANHTTTVNGQLPFDSLSTEIPSQRSTGYSTANRRFTAPVTGLYQFSVSLDFAGNYSNYYFWCGINGGGRYRDFLENVDILANGGFYSTFSIHMTTGDYTQLHSGVTGINLYGGNAAWNCVWQGHLIG